MRSLVQPKRPRRGLVAATAAVGLLAASCGAAEEATDAATDSGSGEQASQNQPTFDATIFSGEALTVSGDSFDLGSLADKDLVLWFWAPW